MKEKLNDIVFVPYELIDLNPVQGVLMFGDEMKDIAFSEKWQRESARGFRRNIVFSVL